jgi:hypothetical protein
LTFSYWFGLLKLFLSISGILVISLSPELKDLSYCHLVVVQISAGTCANTHTIAVLESVGVFNSSSEPDAS